MWLPSARSWCNRPHPTNTQANRKRSPYQRNDPHRQTSRLLDHGVSPSINRMRSAESGAAGARRHAIVNKPVRHCDVADAADVASIDVLSAPEALTEQAENLRNDVVLWRPHPDHSAKRNEARFAGTPLRSPPTETSFAPLIINALKNMRFFLAWQLNPEPPDPKPFGAATEIGHDHALPRTPRSGV